MAHYVQKNPQCDAVQWLGDNLADVQKTFPDATEGENDTLLVPAELGGVYAVPLNHWVLRDSRTKLTSYLDPDGFDAIWGRG